jgi:hypothetical protein
MAIGNRQSDCRHRPSIGQNPISETLDFFRLPPKLGDLRGPCGQVRYGVNRHRVELAPVPAVSAML